MKNAIITRSESLFNDEDLAEHFRGYAYQVAGSFQEAFFNDATGWLNDCILPDGTGDATLRPNQIYAVSLAHSALSEEQQKRVVEIVRAELLTPFGLRSLSRDDERYLGRYEGDQMQRDRAYHNGTVWSHLIGPFVEAFLRVNPTTGSAGRRALRCSNRCLTISPNPAAWGAFPRYSTAISRTRRGAASPRPGVWPKCCGRIDWL